MPKYRLLIPKNSEIEKSMDNLIRMPYIENVGHVIKLDNPKLNQRMGQYVAPLKNKGVIGFFSDLDLKETVCILKVKNIEKRNGNGKTLWYEFELPNI